jgi:hypothetical protein
MTDAATSEETASDAAVPTDAIVLDGGSATDASVPDLGLAVTEASAEPEPRTCPDVAGTYELTTERTRGGLRTDATYGSYRLILSAAGEGLGARLERIS